MKHFSNILKYSLVLSLVVAMASCGGSDDPDPVEDTTLQDVFNLLSAGQASYSSVTKPSDATELNWDDLVVTFGGTVDAGTYSTTGSADATVWPSSGTWTFTDATGTKITRNDGVIVNVAVSATTLNTTFTIPEPGARTMVVDGEWNFEFAY